MKIKSPMLVVTDIDKSAEFYKNVFGLHVILDFGANKTLTGGFALQTLETWQEFIVQMIFHLEAIVLRFILRKIILINLQSKYSHSTF